MNTFLIAFQIVAGAGGRLPGRIDQVCMGTDCNSLTVQRGIVQLTDSGPPSRTLVMGKYIEAAQHFVPRSEAPVRDVRSAGSWRVIVSAFLEHSEPNKGRAGLRLRFFNPSGKLEGSVDIDESLEGVEVGYLFGGEDDIFAVTSNEEHAYNVRTEIWLLPPVASPKRLLALAGVYETFSHGAPGRPAGVLVARETYDGVHAETKGRVEEFFTWDAKTKSLILRTPKE